MMLRWESLKGQDTAVAALQQMLRQEQSPHAFLFTGIEGVGKRLAAKTLIAALLCQEQERPCGVCSSLVTEKHVALDRAQLLKGAFVAHLCGCCLHHVQRFKNANSLRCGCFNNVLACDFAVHRASPWFSD